MDKNLLKSYLSMKNVTITSEIEKILKSILFFRKEKTLEKEWKILNWKSTWKLFNEDDEDDEDDYYNDDDEDDYYNELADKIKEKKHLLNSS